MKTTVNNNYSKIFNNNKGIIDILIDEAPIIKIVTRI